MNKNYLLHNCIIVSPGLFIKNGEILVENGIIKTVGRAGEISRHLDEGELKHVVGARFLLPVFVNPHTHLYSSLSAGLSPKKPSESFTDVLKNFWWPLDAAMDEQSVYYSALSGILDAIKHGVTCIVDHHASMNYVEGSLKTIEGALNLAGIKAVLCFETSNRNSITGPGGHLQENTEFIKSHLENRRIRGMLGMHANFTLGDDELKAAADITSMDPDRYPVHIHCGESTDDLDFCLKQGFKGPVDRLNSFGLIGSKTILAHCIHLSDEDRRLLDKLNPWIISNPESNANNRVGHLDRSLINRYLIGTDGMSFDMIASLRAQYLLGRGLSEDFSKLHDVFINYPQNFISGFFPNTGKIEADYDADIAVLDYIPETPLDSENIIGHLIYGARGGKVFMTISDGNILYKDGKITFTFESSIRNEIQEAALQLHRRYHG
jgi:cytosine/adenosine deaminase-related metal-dependent hydrolase